MTTVSSSIMAAGTDGGITDFLVVVVVVAAATTTLCIFGGEGTATSLCDDDEEEDDFFTGVDDFIVTDAAPDVDVGGIRSFDFDVPAFGGRLVVIGRIAIVLSAAAVVGLGLDVALTTPLVAGIEEGVLVLLLDFLIESDIIVVVVPLSDGASLFRFRVFGSGECAATEYPLFTYWA